MASILSFDERPVTAVRLIGPILVETGQGEIEGKLGDYLVVTTAGRQIVMSEGEYRTATGASDLETVVSPVVAPVPKLEEKKGIFGSLFTKRGAVRQKARHTEGRFSGFMFFGKKSNPAEPSELLANIGEYDPGPHVEISEPIDLCQVSISEEPPANMSSQIDIPDYVSTPVDIQVKQPERIQSSDQIESEYTEVTEEVMTNIPPDKNCHNLSIVVPIETVPPIYTPRNPPKPTPRVEYDPLSDPENLIIPKREPGAFLEFMRPGSGATKRPAGKKEKKPFAFVSAFKKKPKVLEPEPIKDRWPTVQPEWI